jgi:hypothetical protein
MPGAILIEMLALPRNSSIVLATREPRMTKKKLDWKPDLSMPVGKGATVQRFTAAVDDERLEIDTEPWGEGDLKINDQAVAHVVEEKSSGDAFRDLEAIAEEVEKRKAIPIGKKRRSPRPR